MLFLALAMLPVAVWSWSFTLEDSPTQCNLLAISWDGGEAPHTFSFLGLSGIGTNLSSWGTGYALQYNADASDVGTRNITGAQDSWPVPFAAGTPLIIIGSDNTGFGTGGTSDVYIIQPNPEGFDGCVSAYNDTSLSQTVPLWGTILPYQCGPMVDLLSNVTFPVQTAVVIPGGESFLVENTIYYNTSGEVGAAAQKWNMTVPAGTDVAFWVQDARGSVLVSGLQTVQLPLSNHTCLTDRTAYPSTAAAAPGTLSTSPTTSSTSGNTNHVGAIAGGVIGSIAGLVIIVALVMFIMHRYNSRKRLLKRQTIGLVTYAARPASEPSRLEGETWPKEKKDGFDEGL